MSDSNILSARIKIKHDTAKNWEKNNIVLLSGELGIDTTNRIIKCGNGISTWKNLPVLTRNLNYISEISNDIGYITADFLLKNNYLTAEQLETILTNKNYATKAFVANELNNYATKKYVDDAIDEIIISGGGGSGGFDDAIIAGQKTFVNRATFYEGIAITTSQNNIALTDTNLIECGHYRSNPDTGAVVYYETWEVSESAILVPDNLGSFSYILELSGLDQDYEPITKTINETSGILYFTNYNPNLGSQWVDGWYPTQNINTLNQSKNKTYFLAVNLRTCQNQLGISPTKISINLTFNTPKPNLVNHGETFLYDDITIDGDIYLDQGHKVIGELQGNASTASLAEKATQDASGNIITNTYATKDEVKNKLDSNGFKTAIVDGHTEQLLNSQGEVIIQANLQEYWMDVGDSRNSLYLYGSEDHPYYNDEYLALKSDIITVQITDLRK